MREPRPRDVSARTRSHRLDIRGLQHAARLSDHSQPVHNAVGAASCGCACYRLTCVRQSNHQPHRALASRDFNNPPHLGLGRAPNPRYGVYLGVSKKFERSLAHHRAAGGPPRNPPRRRPVTICPVSRRRQGCIHLGSKDLDPPNPNKGPVVGPAPARRRPGAIGAEYAYRKPSRACWSNCARAAAQSPVLERP